MSSRFTKKSLVNVPGRSVNTPCPDCPVFAFKTRMPPTSAVISGAVSVSRHARSTSRSSGDCLPARPGGNCGTRLRWVRARQTTPRPSTPATRPCDQPQREPARRDRRLCRSLLDACAPGQDDQVGERDLLPSVLRAVEIRLDLLQRLQHLVERGRIVYFPVLLRGEADARAVRATALVGAAERCRRCPSGRDQLGNGQTGGEDLRFEVGDILLPDQLVIHGGDGILPQLRLCGNQGSDIPTKGSHVAVEQLEPRLGKGVFEVRGIFEGSAWKSARSPGPPSVRGLW